MPDITFTEKAFAEYMAWQQDKATMKRINDADRLVYRVTENAVIVLQCKGHYDD